MDWKGDVDSCQVPIMLKSFENEYIVYTDQEKIVFYPKGADFFDGYILPNKGCLSKISKRNKSYKSFFWTISAAYPFIALILRNLLGSSLGIFLSIVIYFSFYSINEVKWRSFVKNFIRDLELYDPGGRDGGQKPLI